MKLIDSHCHLHDPDFFPDNREQIYQNLLQSDIGAICVGTDGRSSRESVRFTKNRRNVWSSIGTHPHEAKTGYQEIIEILKSANRSKVVAIGEIGLDYFYEHSSRKDQIEALEGQIQLAIDYDLPISFHVRDAFDDFWPIFDNFSGVRGALHSFTDNQANLEQGFSRGLFVGLNGISTFTRDDNQRQMYYNVPPNRLLLETDAPYLTPRPLRGKMNEPKYVELVARYWSDARNIDFDKFCQLTQDNTRLLFGI